MLVFLLVASVACAIGLRLYAKSRGLTVKEVAEDAVAAVIAKLVRPK